MTQNLLPEIFDRSSKLLSTPWQNWFINPWQNLLDENFLSQELSANNVRIY